MLELRDIHKEYRLGENTVTALNGVSLTIEDGDFVAIMGPSGSGKSTLLHILGLLDVPDRGSYNIDGVEAAQRNDDELAVLRRNVLGFVFQQFNLLPRINALENVALPLLYSEKRQDFQQARLLLEQVGLGTRLIHRPNELSGGQQQRVAIARALIHQPRMILADEPTGNLDSSSTEEILALLKSLNRSGITLIIVTHEPEIGRQAHRLLRLRDGQLVSDERLRPRQNPSSGAQRQPAALRPAAFGLGELFEHFRQGFKALAANKVRTALSMLGILIGVAAVVAMLAIGLGARQAVQKQLASLGSNLLMLRPGATRVGGVTQQIGSSTRLTLEDVASLQEQIPSLTEVSPLVNGRGQLSYGDKNWNTQILGSAPPYARMHASLPAVGRFFTAEENQLRKRVAVIGNTVARELFGQQSPIGERIKINRVNFQVIGVLPIKGGGGFHDNDDLIVIPVLTAMHRLLGKDYIDYLEVEVASAEQIPEAQTSMLNLILSRHKVPPSQSNNAFIVRNLADLQAAISESSRTMSWLLAAIAAISLLVGGIGIMNIMLVSVTERTREIGLRKAVGARRRDILWQFLVEAMVISTVGGICGILLGWLITLLVAHIAGWATAIAPSAVALAFCFSAGVGILFGLYPARRASLLHPIDALRYE